MPKKINEVPQVNLEFLFYFQVIKIMLFYINFNLFLTLVKGDKFHNENSKFKA
jgi:hypothetical protein